MRIFALLFSFGFCLGAVGQDSLVKVDRADREGGNYSRPTEAKPRDSENAIEASMIVQQLFAGMKTPCPVTPPLVESIQSELKKEEPNWFPVNEAQAETDVRMATASQVDPKLFAAPKNQPAPGSETVVGNPEPLVRNLPPVGSATAGNNREAVNAVQEGVDSHVSSKSGGLQAEPVIAEPARKRPFEKLFKSNPSRGSSSPIFGGRKQHPGDQPAKGGLFKRLLSKSKKADDSGEVQAGK